MLLLASLVAALLSPAHTETDTVIGRDSRAACDSGASMNASGAADLRAALEAHGGVVRWDVVRGPVRLWVQRRPDFAADVSISAAQWRLAVSSATDAWRDVVPQLAFALEPDSVRADVIVTWVRDLADTLSWGELAFRAAGRTTLVPGQDGRALLAHVRLAVFAPGAVRYSLEDVRAVARHELGHVLGLAHHAAPSSVMAPLVRAERLTDEDRATLRALYSLPIGARCVVMPAGQRG